jgi:molybdopterin converting factor small subunit
MRKSIRIRVKYFLLPRVLPKMEEVDVEVPRLGHLIEKLKERYGKELLKELLSPLTLILINGKPEHYVDEFHVELKDGDEITFLHVVDGG